MGIFQKPLLAIERLLRGLRRRVRNCWYRTVLQQMGNGCQISENVFITGADKVSLGSRVIINDGAIIQSCEGAEIHIGNQVNIAYGAVLITGGLDMTDGIDHDKHIASPIIVGDAALIGARAIILPGITIGEGACISAGSLVTQDVPAHTLVFGSPARALKVFKKKSESD